MTRVGQFTSSSIHKLMTTGRQINGFGKPATTYIQEKRYELRLGRSINKEAKSHSLLWGRLCEKRAFDLLGLEYVLESKTRYSHPDIPEWSGMPDCTQPAIVSDIKCPWTIKSAVELIESFTTGGYLGLKNHAPEYYWQLVSNGILTDVPKAELIVYVPYKDEIQDIRESIEDYEDPDALRWMYYCEDDELPYLIQGKHYKNLTTFGFDIPEEDKELLTERVKAAVELLNSDEEL
jgi:hypothetical protein